MPNYMPPLLAKRTAANSFAFVGDSRISQMISDGSYTPPGTVYHLKSNHFFNVANALLGQRMRIVYEAGISGYRSDQYLVNLPAAIASGAAWLMIWGVVNDIAQSGTTGDTAATIWARIKNAALAGLNAGMNVILVSETGSTSLSSGALQGMVHQYNEYAREFCASTQGAYFFDAAAVAISPTASTTTAIAFNANYSTDGTHLNGYGSWYVGSAFASFIGALVPPAPSQIFSANEVSSNGNIQQLANPLFTTATGGTFGSGCSGTIPLSFYADNNSTGASATFSTSADAGGFGNDMNIAVTFAAAGDKIRITQTTTIGNYAIPGDIIEGGCEVVVASGSSNLNAAYISINQFPTQPNDQTDLYPLNSQALPPVAMDLVQRTLPLPILASTTAVVWQFKIVASGAGSANITLKRPWLRRRFSV